MLNCSASLVMSTCVLKALPGKLNIKRHSPSILYTFADSIPFIENGVDPDKLAADEDTHCFSPT